MAAPRLAAEEGVPREAIERMKQLVLDGKREQAIDLYAQTARIDRAAAEAIVNDLLLANYFALTRSMPINAFGFVLYFMFISGGLGLAAVGAWLARESLAWALLVPLGLVFAVLQIRGFVPKVVSTWVNAYGAEGRARIVRVATLRRLPGSVLAQVAFSVEPNDGSAPFFDEEILLVHPVSFEKLRPSHIVRVRFDEPKRQRVFPISPIEVIGVAQSYR